MRLNSETEVESTRNIGHDVAPATSQLRTEHQQETSALQKAVDHLTASIGWPGFVAVLAGTIVVWIVANLLMAHWDIRPIDQPPFAWLEVAISIGALFVAVLILTTQRQEDQLASRRLQLILEPSRPKIHARVGNHSVFWYGQAADPAGLDNGIDTFGSAYLHKARA